MTFIEQRKLDDVINLALINKLDSRLEFNSTLPRGNIAVSTHSLYRNYEITCRIRKIRYLDIDNFWDNFIELYANTNQTLYYPARHSSWGYDLAVVFTLDSVSNIADGELDEKGCYDTGIGEHMINEFIESRYHYDNERSLKFDYGVLIGRYTGILNAGPPSNLPEGLDRT